VTSAFRGLVADGVLAVVGPSISDNGLLIGPLADELRVPCINYTGGERTRGHWMFHYQIGSLEEEPVLLAEHLLAAGLHTVAVVYDDSPVGRRYAECFADTGADLVASASISALAEDIAPVLRRLAAAAPQALVYFGLGVASRAVALAVEELAWDVPVVANSSLMFGYARPDWRAGYEGWVYVDTVADANASRTALAAQSKAHAGSPIGCAAYDMGRLLGAGIARSGHLSRAGVRDGLERVKRLPATSGKAGTTMGFGAYDHGALKGDYLVLRSWQGGRTVEVSAPPA
jgi:ABC-type branched-subunit amino acid transport system substrate-binding protein